MKCKLLPKLSTGDWKDFCDRFHFPAKELRRIQAIYQALLPLVDCYAYYSLKQDLPGISLSHYAYGFVTLGNGVDEFSELYLNHRYRRLISWIVSASCSSLRHTRTLPI